MPTVSGSSGDDVESQEDEIKVFKYEGDEEEQEKRSSENLTEDKSSLITETEEVCICSLNFTTHLWTTGIFICNHYLPYILHCVCTFLVKREFTSKYYGWGLALIEFEVESLPV